MRAKFFKLYPNRASDNNFESCIADLNSAFSEQIGFYQDIGSAHIRVERFNREDGYCTGDFIRQQNDELPPFAQNGTNLEPNTIPLGHSSAFLYHYSSNTLILESAKNGANIGSIMKLITLMLDHRAFSGYSIVNHDSIEDLLSKNPRRLTVKFAAPENMAIAETTNNDIINLNNMRNLMEAPTLEMTFGFDSSKKGHLNKNQVVDFIRRITNSNVDISKIQVKTEDSADILDLLGKKLTFTENLTIQTDNLDSCFEQRKGFLIRAYQAHAEYINNFYSVRQYGT